ncbi:Pfam:DUF2349 [Geosmithia morbida]|uniref:Pfam:DUF2349 n=1 Tax=Geosmithia morbida TaxID=1094350 RepID=A0A9P5D2H4_9HYPO|nr:Pfam:DUF2349 [Geosmithia morbida]KAF4119509.1 Pfam:DUF2349 [Geosmithia morbida]
MPRLRARYLSCFYCGKRSGTRFDGVTRQFTCQYCDATNYLDQNGEITDPPVATEYVAPTATMPATIKPLSTSPSSLSTPSRPIFCDTCLKNQRLFMASLAQYAPSNGDQDDIQLDREYYRFRRRLEKRYPQVCGSCEAAAGEAIQRAEYTAKTDHLRKMMELGRRQRSAPRRRAVVSRTWLEWVDLLARTAWWGALALQLLWHVGAVAGLLSTPGEDESGMRDPDDDGGDGGAWAATATAAAAAFTAELRRRLPPDGDERALLRASVAASLASAWWNPKFPQVTRGFTRQLSGLRQWYLVQAVAVAARLAVSRTDLSGQARSAQLSAHGAMALLAVISASVARRSIKTDTRPLFGPHSRTVSPSRMTSSSPSPAHQPPAATTPPKRRQQQQQQQQPRSLAETLDEVLPDPTTDPTTTTTSTVGASTPTWTDELYHDYQFTPGRPSSRTSPQASQPDEMDWTPTAPQILPRALKDAPSPTHRRFGQAPTHEGSGPFYYRTPPAPVHPARRLRNPPNQPAFWPSASSSAEKENESQAPFRRAGYDMRQHQTAASAAAGVEFAKQNFFAPRQEAAEDESLASMLGSGFRLEDDEGKKGGGKSWLSWR